MACLSLKLYDTPGFAPRMNVLFWGPGDFPSKLLKQGYLAARLKSSFRKFYGRYGDIIQQYEVSLSKMLNGILILDQPIRLSTNFTTFILTFTDYEWFPWSICNGCGIPAGNAYPSGHLVTSPIVGLACTPIVETRFLELAMSLLDFSPRISLGTFSILLRRRHLCGRKSHAAYSIPLCFYLGRSAIAGHWQKVVTGLIVICSMCIW